MHNKLMSFTESLPFIANFTVNSLNREERIYCYLIILLSLIKIWKANVEILYSLVLVLSRKQPADLLSVSLVVKS